MDEGDAKTAGEEGGLARKRQASLCGSVHLSIYLSVYKLLVKIKQCALSCMNYIDVSILCSCSFLLSSVTGKSLKEERMLQEEVHGPQNRRDGETSHETEEPPQVEKSMSFYLSFFLFKPDLVCFQCEVSQGENLEKLLKEEAFQTTTEPQKRWGVRLDG